jgi:hypothetical protein
MACYAATSRQAPPYAVLSGWEPSSNGRSIGETVPSRQARFFCGFPGCSPRHSAHHAALRGRQFRLSGADRRPPAVFDRPQTSFLDSSRPAGRIGINVPTDIIVATPEDFELYKDTTGLIYRPALKEGKVVYAT